MSDVTWTRTEDVVVWQSTQNPATVWRVETGTPSGGGTGVEWPVVGTPAEFPPEAHTHPLADLTTSELDTSKVVKPDGSGGFTWGDAPSGDGDSGPPLIESTWYLAAQGQGMAIESTGRTASADTFWLWHFRPRVECRMTGLRIYCHNAPTAGTTLRFGAYAAQRGIVPSASNLVGALLGDFGAVPCTSEGWKGVTGLNVVVPSEGILVGVARQNTGGTLPSLTGPDRTFASTGSDTSFPLNQTATPQLSTKFGLFIPGVSGDLPANPTNAVAPNMSLWTTWIPQFQVQVVAL